MKEHDTRKSFGSPHRQKEPHRLRVARDTTKTRGSKMRHTCFE
jgi:hypothetical protein